MNCKLRLSYGAELNEQKAEKEKEITKGKSSFRFVACFNSNGASNLMERINCNNRGETVSSARIFSVFFLFVVESKVNKSKRISSVVGIFVCLWGDTEGGNFDKWKLPFEGVMRRVFVRC